MSTLAVEQLTIATADCVIVENVSLSVAAGEILAVLGETGSGKSLIGSAIMGLIPKGVSVSGRIVVNGRSYDAADSHALRTLWAKDLFLLPQEPLNALAPLLSAAAQVAEQIKAPFAGADAAAALSAMQLDRQHHRKRPFELSGGMAQRVMAAIASVTRAGIVLADEPTKGLDADRRDIVARAFSTLRERGRAILLITHDIALVRALADQVAFLDERTIIERGAASTVLSSPGTAYARRYVASDPSTWPARPYERSRSAKVIEADHLRIGINGKVLADDLTFHCHAGHIAALLGRSGIGKTTLGRTLLGLTPPLSGTIRRPHGNGGVALQKLHQDPTRVFSPWQSLGQSLEDMRRLPGGDQALRRVPALLQRFGLARDLLLRQPHQISGGEAQRVALARILALKPKMLIADEPTSRLDPPVQEQVIRYLRDVADEDALAILLITHDRALANAMADRRMVMAAEACAPARLLDVTRPHPASRSPDL
ncbi:ABC transporter ATP-binding protein [Chelatococcus asaccharovorans]|uniref:Peptide/nickel transport system ATP-binding protein n=1 Tax=Chelatococcus asaccharovorans TaxID=28210 RepID=A0A2V3U6K1_9HYPH|nr:ATP-binding cassette domain-containing protein [Chelatococcus asaccharovorans]MBS7705667.1 ABC transporter ATP-binding protein [Chelatococcus asaccharovorans]PXW58685.1 peptide/nickel transport system ATP-binding protein [Chelatococcus asaccharovorans]